MSSDFEAFLARWDRFVENIISRVYSHTFSRDDLRQEAHIVLWDLWKRYEHQPDIDRIIRSKLLGSLRKTVKRRERGRIVEREVFVLDDVVIDEDGIESTWGTTLPGLSPASSVPVRLSPRESQVFRLKAFEGLTSKEIATRLGISPVTVRRYWSLARDKIRGAVECA